MCDFSKYDPKVVALFQKYDINKNNTLEKKEFVSGLGELIKCLEPSMGQDKIDSLSVEVIKIFDLNKNGTIEINEFDALIKFLVDEKGLDLH